MLLIAELLSDIKKDFQDFSFKSVRSLLALKATVASLLALFIAWELNIFNPVWAGLTAFFVIQITFGASMIQTVERIAATLVGASCAMLILAVSLNNIPVLIIMTFVLIMISFYFLAKSPNPFVWLYVPITVLLIIFSTVGMKSIDISSYAYYRALEISIGSICGMCVAWLFWTPSTRDNYCQKRTQLLKQISEVLISSINQYQGKASVQILKKGLRDLLQTVSEYNGLRRFVKHEVLIGRRKAASDNLDVLAVTLQESLCHITNAHHQLSAPIATEFDVELNQIKHHIALFFDGFAVGSDAGKIDYKLLLEDLQLWESCVEQFVKKAEAFRNSDKFDYSIDISMEWNHFLRLQYETVLLIKAYLRSRLEVDKAPKAKQKLAFWKRFVKYDRYYMEYAIKTALAAVVFPLGTMALNLPSGVMLSVLVIINLQFDLTVTKRKLVAFSTGCTIGAISYFMIVFCNFSNIGAYFVSVAIFLFGMGYLFHSDGNQKFVGLFASVVFLIGVTHGGGPIMDWRWMLILLVEIWAAAIILLVFLIWIWPFTDRKLLMHHQLQIEREQAQLKTALENLLVCPEKNEGLFFPWANFKAIRSQLKQVSDFNWRSKASKVQANKITDLQSAKTYALSSLFNILKWADLQKMDPAALLQVKKILGASADNELTEITEFCTDYLNTLRQKFLQGDKLPFIQGVQVSCLVSLIKELAENGIELVHFANTRSTVASS